MSDNDNFVDIADRVRKVVVTQLGAEEDNVTLESSFSRDLGADSLDTVELVMAFEEEFDMEIPDAVAEEMFTVRHVCDYIQQHLAQSTKASEE
nr:acyl carrier protein [Rickettsiella massiliensis]